MLDAAKFDLDFSSRFFHVEAGGVAGVNGEVRSGGQRSNRRRLEAQFLGAENVFDRNDQPLRLTPRKRRRDCGKVRSVLSRLEQTNSGIAASERIADLALKLVDCLDGIPTGRPEERL